MMVTTKTKWQIRPIYVAISLLLSFNSFSQSSHQVTFCGEPVPISNQFVAEKLMGIIKKMMPMVNMKSIRDQAIAFFPYIESQLAASGLPTDLKYIAVVESNLKLAVSPVGARGFWQLMEPTAKGYGLIVEPGGIDERDDIVKSTRAACSLLRDFYSYIARTHKVKSWVLTAAAYNYGNGNITKAIRNQGTSNYFNMNLNPETAIYVYKIIAVKELFENPELYMKDFGYNIFSAKEPSQANKQAIEKEASKIDTAEYVDLQITAIEVPVDAEEQSIVEVEVVEKPRRLSFMKATIVGKYASFNDGDLLDIKISENLISNGSFRKKGSIIKGKGYIIDGRVLVDLGYEHSVMLYDFTETKGFPLDNLADGYTVLLGIEQFD